MGHYIQNYGERGSCPAGKTVTGTIFAPATVYLGQSKYYRDSRGLNVENVFLLMALAFL